MAKYLARKYAGQTFTLSGVGLHDGPVCKFATEIGEPVDRVSIWPSNITQSGIATDTEAKHANEFCNVMYGMLRNEPYFDFAITGVEVFDFMEEIDDLKTLLKSNKHEMYDGLVVSYKLLDKWLGSHHECFEKFSATHAWIPKRPEVCQVINDA
jgi:hypothetical protein